MYLGFMRNIWIKFRSLKNYQHFIQGILKIDSFYLRSGNSTMYFLSQLFMIRAMGWLRRV